MNEPVTMQLRSPIKVGAHTLITELSFRPLKAKDLRGIQRKEGFEFDFMLALAGRLSGQPTNVIDELTSEDLAEVATIVTGFLQGSPPTGSAPSPS